MKNISLLKGDITTAQVDAIVNAANPKMLGGGGVDGAIHKAAGPDLLLQCRKVESTNGIRCPFGEARLTTAGNLKAKYVIHTAGPIYNRSHNAEKTLRSSYENSLDLALSNECNSIALPAISCGAYGYPLIEAAHISIQVSMLKKYQNLEITFYLYSNELLEIWKSALANLSK